MICRFPSLAKLAKRYLAMPATEVASERIFSIAGLTITKLRSQLDPGTVDAVIFLNKNYKPEVQYQILCLKIMIAYIFYNKLYIFQSLLDQAELV